MHSLLVIGVTCGVDFLFDIGCLCVIIGGLASFAEFITLYALDVSLGRLVPSLGKFVIGGSLFEKFDRLLCPLNFVSHDISEERTLVYAYLPLSFL